jgi:hypothetical protein
VSQFIYQYAECHYAECRYAECWYAGCHYAECRYAECRYAACRYAECRYAECRYAECPGTLKVATPIKFLWTIFMTGGKYYKSVTIVIYNRNDTGLYHKTHNLRY